MSEGKVGCSEKVHDAFGVGFHPCSRVGRVERDGKWYCSQHDPCYVKKRREQRQVENQQQLKHQRIYSQVDMDAALRRAKAEVWQPFETAPKEWNEILIVYTKCRPRVYELVCFNTVHKYWMCKGEPRLNLERSECYWMPISNFDAARAAQIEEGE